MGILRPRNLLYRMPQPEHVTTCLVPCHKAPLGYALLYRLVVATSMHQCGGSLCLLYCRLQTYPSHISRTHCLLGDDPRSRVSAPLLSSSMQQLLRMPPCHLGLFIGWLSNVFCSSNIKSNSNWFSKTATRSNPISIDHPNRSNPNPIGLDRFG